MALRGSVKYVMNAVHALKEAKGATMKQIIDFIADVKGGFDKFAVRKALDQCVAKGTLKLANGKYTSAVDESGLPEITGARRRTRRGRGRRRRSRSGRRRRRRSRMMLEETSGLGDNFMSGRRRRRRRSRRSRRNTRRRAVPDLQQNAQGTSGDPENGQKDENDVKVQS